MTEPTATPPAPLRPGRGLKIALALSVALNLAVAGLVVGAWASGHGPRHGGPRDLSFGPFSAALSPQDRRALRQAFLDRTPDLRSSREAARAEFQTLLSALRARPFDPAALSTALAAIETRNASRLELGRSLLEARLAGMDEAERLAFADRLEAGLRHRD
mgnify:CR=1 FL=1